VLVDSTFTQENIAKSGDFEVHHSANFRDRRSSILQLRWSIQRLKGLTQENGEILKCKIQ
jgi:hypothetical protein